MATDYLGKLTCGYYIIAGTGPNINQVEYDWTGILRQAKLAVRAAGVSSSALDALKSWDHFYNYVRPHSALKYLCPADYYRGDSVARLAEREAKLVKAVEIRRAYWRAIYLKPGWLPTQ